MSLAIRDAVPADYEVFTRFFRELKIPDPVPTPAEFEERMLPSVILAEDGMCPVGYAHWRFYGATAHVAHVVVAPEARGRGVGGALLRDLRGRACARGSGRWYLNVKADNAPAIHLYESVGLSVEQRGWSLSAPWSALRAIEGSTDTVRVEPADEEASTFARQHGLDPERVALVRARPGVVFVALRGPAGISALAAFDPAFPGIYPIAVARPGDARGLFDAFFPHAQGDRVNLFVEGDAALADVLRGAGATLSFESLRMGGALA